MKLGDTVQSWDRSTGEAETGGLIASFEVSLSCTVNSMLARETDIVLKKKMQKRMNEVKWVKSRAGDARWGRNGSTERRIEDWVFFPLVRIWKILLVDGVTL